MRNEWKPMSMGPTIEDQLRAEREARKIAVKKLNDIAQGNVEPGVVTDALLMAGKAAFQERIFSWFQETARDALLAIEKLVGKDA